MIVKYTILNPTGNITALAETPVKTELQPQIALKIMEREPTVEQVGYVSGNSLRMAGGEFCGNATMSAAALICSRNGLEAGKKTTVELFSSGAGELSVKIKANSDGSFAGTVQMPMPLSIENVSLDFDGKRYTLPAVRFSGITHLINEGTVDKPTAEAAIKKWCADLNTDGVGIMFYDRENSTLEPLVYVREPETLFWESSCASGTSAVGAFVSASENRTAELTLSEKGGRLTVRADKEKIILTGNVRIIDTKIIEI